MAIPLLDTKFYAPRPRDGRVARPSLTERLDRGARSKLTLVSAPAGFGKSTLVAALIGEVRRVGRTVAVVAVDPSSPITGGALLGDRVRMQSYADDDGVFIRSMASRGHAGGLASTSAAAASPADPRECAARRNRRAAEDLTPKTTERLLIDGPAGPDDVLTVDDRDRLERAFRRLPPDQRAVLVLTHYLGLTPTEIAERLEIPVGTARSRLHYAHRAMRAAIEADERPAAVAGGRLR